MKKTRDRIPMMFRAQIEGRCQIQKIFKNEELQKLQIEKQYSYCWVDEWLDGVEETVPKFDDSVQTREYEITWRFVTNSGQDEGITRPVIGANGFPFYPGSSMKGGFSRECTDTEALKYCGGQFGKETQQGILRFHGGYPQDLNWIEQNLVDVVHPQEAWQLKTSETNARQGKKGGAFAQISLYKPTLVFGISAIEKLDNTEWLRIWEIWEKSLSKGIGSRVSAGYGQPKIHAGNTLLSVSLKGQGLASKLVNPEGKLGDDLGEFRPNVFKAALRGHTLRLLGGVTDEATAEKLTKQLWGGFAGKNGAIVGQVGIAFDAIDLKIGNFTYTHSHNPIDLPIYNLKQGRLDLLSMQNPSEKQQKILKVFLGNLIQFSFLLGGFGKSWRRIDHRLFFSDYLTNNNKPLIGCHWEFIEQSRQFYIPIKQLQDVTVFLNTLYQNIQKFVEINKESILLKGCNWREVFHPAKVQIWGRIAEDRLDSKAIYWFHSDYQQGKTIKQSDLTGKLNQIGRIWHRMYPQYIKEDGKLKKTGKYIELLTIFPDDSNRTLDFLNYLEKVSEFEKLWGGNSKK